MNGNANANNKTIKDANLTSGVWTAPDPSISLSKTKAVPTANKMTQKMLTIHQKIQLTFKSYTPIFFHIMFIFQLPKSD